VSADRHWVALDRAFSRVLSAAQVAQARERFAPRAAALSDIYLPRLLEAAHQSSGDGSDSTSKLAKLRQTSRELSATLSASWAESEDAFRKL
jgi:hypothetical protein